MTLQEFGLLFVSILASVIGQFLLKAGALKLGAVDANNAISHILGMITVPELVGGLISYAIGAIAYILLLTRVSLSVAAPAVALTYVFAVTLGHFMFREAIPLERLIGLGLIICGVILVVWQK
ncbi:MAG: EamA family transporter [Pegethrix bostrychoides GSE-TBD4-15B]|uniref:EamA family transporter n=1 Tax=Pegethrix bostrychoides GSE-TBD4-15B TaxID=2839662 RepID=A0A951PGC8_9CYAN|nr:EamA family transporter [Pegethrix bostrychoides GSE-TBD4-15B]